MDPHGSHPRPLFSTHPHTPLKAGSANKGSVHRPSPPNPYCPNAHRDQGAPLSTPHGPPKFPTLCTHLRTPTFRAPSASEGLPRHFAVPPATPASRPVCVRRTGRLVPQPAPPSPNGPLFLNAAAQTIPRRPAEPPPGLRLFATVPHWTTVLEQSRPTDMPIPPPSTAPSRPQDPTTPTQRAPPRLNRGITESCGLLSGRGRLHSFPHNSGPRNHLARKEAQKSSN